MFSPYNSIKKKIGTENYCCSHCNRQYEKLDLDDKDWLAGLSIEVGAMKKLKKAFQDLQPENVADFIQAFARVDQNIYHLIMSICNRRIFLTCNMLGRTLVAREFGEISDVCTS